MSTPRVPLGDISGNRRKNCELTPVQRGFIEGAVKFGASFSKVAETVDCSRSAVKHTIDLAPERPDGNTKKRPGRPKKWDIRLERRILRVVRTFPKWTYRQIIDEIGDDLSKKTIHRILKKNNLTNWIAKKRPFLSIEVAKKRLTWALLHKDWTLENWNIIIWSDECSVERGAGARRTWVWRTPNQKWSKEMIDTYHKGKDISVMVWGAIWVGGRSDIVIMERDESQKGEITVQDLISPSSKTSCRQYIIRA